MISKLVIKNYKSIDELELELGRTNVFIGANGGGKSNILEAVGMAAAAAANRLDNEFLLSRGIRLTGHERMRSGFSPEQQSTSTIDVACFNEVDEPPLGFVARLRHEGEPFGQWSSRTVDDVQQALPHRGPPDFIEALRRDVRERFGDVSSALMHQVFERVLLQQHLHAQAVRLGLSDFLSYTPHEEALRDLARESNIEPIGIHGEGLFRLLQALSAAQLADVKQRLSMIHWFDDLEVQPGPTPNGHSLKIVDHYLADGLAHFDQRSANEGFLFLLLYACLLVSEYTPRFFAVDNVDAALNPKLAAAAVRMFSEMTKANDRQVLLTAHNPGALDGLDLADDAQRLFVVYRDVEGRTRVRRVSPPSDTAAPVRLSEAFLRGYLGGLPDHF
jgi:energy-coupling factor transporter ATP-binding protein EcfA2